MVVPHYRDGVQYDAAFGAVEFQPLPHPDVGFGPIEEQIVLLRFPSQKIPEPILLIFLYK